MLKCTSFGFIVNFSTQALLAGLKYELYLNHIFNPTNQALSIFNVSNFANIKALRFQSVALIEM